MATWAKIKFFYATMLGSTGSTLAADSTASGYDVDDIYNMLETNMWKSANTTNPQYITYDAGVGNTKAADYIIILGHNLNTAGVSVFIQYSSTGAWAGEELAAYAEEGVTSDNVYIKEFASPGSFRYWRLKFVGPTVAPFMAICIWGLKTELDYATASFDPYAQNVKANVGLTQGGYVAGIHTKHTERSLALRFADSDSTLYGKVKTWWDTSGLKNFFVAWDTANNPTDVFLMRPDPSFNNPLTHGGAYRDITINLKGRRE